MLERRFLGDAALTPQFEQGVIHDRHALTPTGLDHRWDLEGLTLANVVLDRRVADHDLESVPSHILTYVRLLIST